MNDYSDKNNFQAVKKMDEVYREAEEINREYDVLVEDLNKFQIKESTKTTKK